MRLLLDGAFPAWATAHGSRLVELGFPAASPRTDAELFAAAEHGCDAVVLMGRESLANAEVLRAAGEAGVGVVVTSADEPMAADRALGDQLPRIAARAGPGQVVLVLADGIRWWPLADLESEPARS